MWPSLLMRVTDRLALGARFFGQLFRTKETEGRTGDLEIALHAARLAEAHHDGLDVFAGHLVLRFAGARLEGDVERAQLAQAHGVAGLQVADDLFLERGQHGEDVGAVYGALTGQHQV